MAGCIDRGLDEVRAEQETIRDYVKDIEEIEPIDQGDYECLAEIREVLKKYEKEERFGIALLHSQFPVDDGEMLVEYTDKEARVLTIKPVKREDVGKTIETIWMLLDGEHKAMLGCRQYCGTDVQGNHNSFHRPT